ncbi:hypothetical protein V9L05_08170 [Bernardetia sp. Wsw4-3y2]|uniref:hypothetical protein n=1 Tax=Bernardetia sp. Wsw4-3y2 TaxID=3127471 RepID=UPI0030CBA2C9
MMSQQARRKRPLESKTRLYDKSKIRILHEKIDHLMMHQQQELLEIQKTQIEMMNTILKNTEKNK